MSLMAVNENQLGLVFDEATQYTRPIEQARAALLNRRPSPVHKDDPPTSMYASIAAALRAPSVRQRVLLALSDAGEYGATDYEVSKVLGILRTTAGKRRVELQRLGLCERTDKRRLTDTATTAVVHRISDLGREVAREIVEENAQ